MTFLNPLVLFGLLAASIPIIIHLFNFRKPKKVDFSSLTFLKELEKSAMQKVRIQQWLLLALRILAITCLVLTFAQPIIQGALSDSKFARSSVALVVDNSFSMNLRDTRGAYLDQAKDVATEIVTRSGQGDEYYLFQTATLGASRTAYRNKEALIERINEIDAQPGAKSLFKTLQQASNELASIENRNKEIYLISDLQRSTFLDSLSQSIPEDVKLVLVPLGDQQPNNVGITDVQIESRIIEAGQPIKLSATLTNYSNTALQEYGVNVYLDGEPAAQNIANIEPNGFATVNFTVTPQKRGWLGGEIRIEDDAFGYDNTRFFTINVPETRTVLVVRGNNQRTNYVELALSSDLTKGRVVFNKTTIPESALPATNISEYDVVVLIGVQDFSSGEIASLTRYIAEGGGVLMFPHEQASQEQYNNFLSGIGGGQVRGYSGTLDGNQTVAQFEQVDKTHPLFEGMFDERGGNGQVESPNIKYYINYNQGVGIEQSLIRLSSGNTFLQEIKYEQGAMLFVTLAPETRWSDLPVRGLFVPLMFRSMYYLASEVSSENLVAQSQGEIIVTGVTESSPLRLRGENGEEFTPEQRSLFGAMLLEMDENIAKAGIYDVIQNEAVLQKVAINTDSKESNLSMLSTEEAQIQLEQATGQEPSIIDTRISGRNRITEALNREKIGMELWNVFLFFALIFLLAEMLVAMQWRKPATAS